MDRLDFQTVVSYLTINRKIMNIKEWIQSSHYNLYTQHSFMSSPLAVDSNGIRVSTPSPHRLVEHMVDTQIMANHVIDILKYKQHHFNKWLVSLSMDDYRYLIDHFLYRLGADNQFLNRQCLNEINEIEEATSWRYGYPVEHHVEFTEDINTNLNKMLEVLG